MDYLAVILFLVGIGIVGAALLIKNLPSSQMAAAVILGGILVVTGGFVVPNAVFEDYLEEGAAVISEDCITTGATGWKITPVDNTVYIDSVWSADKSSCTMAVQTNNGVDSVVFSANKTILDFTIEPVVKTGVETTQLATIFYKTDYTIAYSGHDLLVRSGTTYHANWSDTGEIHTDYDGSDSMQAGSQDNISLCYQFHSEVTNTSSVAYDMVSTGLGATATWDVTFWDDCGFYKTFKMNLVYVGKVFA